MGEVKKGSEAAKETGLALAQIYNHIRAGRVKNHLSGGWPAGKGVEVDMDELRAAIASSGRKPKAAKGSGSNGASGSVGRSRKATKADTDAMHDAIEIDDAERERRRSKRQSGDEGNTVRLRRLDRTSKYPPCPVNPGHGELAPVERDTKKGDAPRFQCWHQDHDGRPKGHPGGFAPSTQFIFTEEEIAYEQPVGPLGVIMLGWISAGRSDLAESLEKWMDKSGLDVWIPVR